MDAFDRSNIAFDHVLQLTTRSAMDDLRPDQISLGLTPWIMSRFVFFFHLFKSYHFMARFLP